MNSSLTRDLRSAKTSDGTEIAYQVYRGRGKGRFALIHSLAMDHRFWDRTVAQLAAAGEILVFDCRGHGASSKSTGPYTGEIFARDLSDLLDHIGWTSTIVAGASMGGCVALSFAASYPTRVDGLGLIDTTAWYGAEAPNQWEERAQKAVTSGIASLVPFQKARWFSAGFAASHPEIVQSAVDVFTANKLDCYVETCRMLGHIDVRSALPRFSFPTRIVVGSEDYATPLPMAESMHQAIPGSTLRVLQGAAHLTPMECPTIIAEELQMIASAQDPSETK
jgi:3-oxoadipate enol-lactonase